MPLGGSDAPPLRLGRMHLYARAFIIPGMRIIPSRVSLAGVVLLFLAAHAPAQTPKKLIEFGWDEPDTAFLREHIATMEQTPFDGTVFHVLYTNKDGSA